MAASVPAPVERLQLTLRLRWLGIAIVIIILILLGQFWRFDYVPVVGIIGITLLELAGVSLIVRRATRHPEWNPKHRDRLIGIISELQVLVELVLLTVGVHLTGGVVSPLLAGYMLYLFVNGLRSSVPMLVVNGIWSALLAVGLIVAEYFGYVQPQSIGVVGDAALHVNSLFVGAVLSGLLAFMLLAAAVAIWIAHQTRQRELALAQSATALARRVEEVNTLREISQRLASTLELQPVLEAIGEGALRLVKATDAHLFAYDQEANSFTTGVGVWADGHRGLVVSLPRTEGGLSAMVVKGKQPVIINDAENHPFYSSLQSRSWGVKAIAGFPLKKADRVLGVLNVAFLEPHQFSDEEVSALIALGDQAAVAVENARLYTQVQARIQELSTLYAVASTSAQLGDAQTLMNDALSVVVDAMQVDAGFLAEVDEGRRQLRLVAQRGLSPVALREIKGEGLSLQNGFAGEAVRTGHAVAAVEILEDVRNVHRFVEADQLHSLYVLPLRAQDRSIGVLQLMWKDKHEVRSGEANLIAAIGHQIAVGFNNLALYGETKRRADELASLRAIGLATTSTLNLREQLRLFYEKVAQLLHPDSFLVGLYDEPQRELQVEYLVEDGWFVRRSTLPLEAGSLPAWVIQNQKALHVPDVASGTNMPAQLSQHLTRPARSWLGVPLVLKDNTAGLIAVTSFKPNAFTPEDERFLSAAAQQAALAIDNARLFAESERRSREMMLINEIGRAVSASLDLDDVIDRAAHALTDLLGYRYISIFFVEGESLKLKAKIGFETNIQSVPLTEGISGRVARTGRPALVTNAATDPDYRPLIPDVVTEVAVPIQREGRVLGVIDVQEARPGALKTDDLVLLGALADQLGVAATNAEIYQEALGREELANSLGRVGLALSSTLDMAQLADLVCREAMSIFRVDGSAIFLRESVPATQTGPVGETKLERHLTCQAIAGVVKPEARSLRVESTDVTNLLVRTARGARGAIIQNAHESPQLTAEWRSLLNARALMAVPLIKERDVIGVLILVDANNPTRFDDSEMARVSILATQAALAISNARLYDETQQRAAEVSSLYEIGLTVSSTLDLKEQLHIIYEQITRHFHPYSFYIGFVEENSEHITIPIISEQGQLLEPFGRHIEDLGFTAWMIQTRRPLVIDDIARDWDQLPVKPVHIGKPTMTSSYFGIPLLSKGRVIGCLALERVPVEPFTLDEQRFLMSLGQQVAVAVDSARLHEQERRIAAQQGLLYQTSRKIASALNLDLLLQTIVDSLHQDFGYKGTVVMLVDQETGDLYAAATSRDVSTVFPRMYRQKVGVGMMGKAAETGETQLANDTSQNHDFVVISDWKPNAELAVPLKAGQSVIGVLNVEREEVNSITQEEVRMVESLADQLTVAIQNARLYEQTRDQLEKLKQTQTRLVESERRAAIGELAAGLAHEINNPLTAILGHTQLMLQAPFTSPENINTELTAINGAAQRIHRIVKEFVRVANVEAIRREVIDMRPVIREAVALVEMHEAAQDVAINVQLPSDNLWVNGSRTLLSQVTSNILMNAVEAMPRGGTIEVDLKADPDDMTLVVHDTGVGIDPENLKHVFEPGYTTKVEKGTVRGVGMGLYTADRIIRNHGGSITLDSVRGQGTTVTIILPRVKKHDDNES
ncbi:MAG: GAF domain-containing protein [Anaerolineae bacterium]